MSEHFEEAKYDERGFVTTVFKSVSDGGTLNLHLKNPSGSGTEAFVSSVNVTTQFQGLVTIHDQFSTAPNSGTSIDTENLLMDTTGTTPDSGKMIANKDVSFTASGDHMQNVIPSGGRGASQSGGRANGTDFILQPEREVVVEVTNQSNSTAPATINIIYREGTAP